MFTLLLTLCSAPISQTELNLKKLDLVEVGAGKVLLADYSNYSLLSTLVLAKGGLPDQPMLTGTSGDKATFGLPLLTDKDNLLTLSSTLGGDLNTAKGLNRTLELAANKEALYGLIGYSDCSLLSTLLVKGDIADQANFGLPLLTDRDNLLTLGSTLGGDLNTAKGLNRSLALAAETDVIRGGCFSQLLL